MCAHGFSNLPGNKVIFAKYQVAAMTDCVKKQAFVLPKSVRLLALNINVSL